MEEPFTRIQMRPQSKRFIANVFTLGFFTKWLLPESKQIIKKNLIPNKNFRDDVFSLEMETFVEKSDESKRLIPQNGNLPDNKKQKGRQKSTWGKFIEGTKEWLYLWMWFMSTRRAKLIEKSVFDFYLVLILAWYSIMGQTYKCKKLDTVLWCVPIMILSRNFRFMFCSFYKVDEYRKHPFRVTQFTVTQYGYIVQFFLLVFCKLICL